MRMAKVALTAAFVALFAAAAQGQIIGPATKPAKPQPTPWPNKAPTVKLVPSTDRVVLAGCKEAADPACTVTSPKVELRAQAADPDGDTMLYTYTTTGGRIEGDGPEVTLDVTGLAPGIYTVTLEVDDGNGAIATDEVKITVERCTCDPPPPPPCPTVDVSCPSDPVAPGRPIKFSASVTGGDPNVTPTFNWAVSVGTISSGQGTSSITVDTTGLSGSFWLTATVNVGGYDRSCSTSASCATSPGDPIVSRKVDEYGVIAVGDEKQRLDNFTKELHNDPTSEGYLLCYGGRRGRANEARRRCDRAKTFLVNSRGIDAARLVTVDAGYREQPTIELWIVPSGAVPPPGSPTVDPSEVRPTAPPRRPRRR